MKEVISDYINTENLDEVCEIIKLPIELRIIYGG